MDSLIYLAVKYVCHYWVKSVILVLCITLAIFLPVAGTAVLDQVQLQLKSRAESTPKVIGAKGSRFDLTLHALYFDVVPPETIRYEVDKTVRDFGYGRVLPIYRTYHIGEDKTPIVGITLSYFDFRNLQIADGDFFGRIGHCVLGSKVAKRLQKSVGDDFVSQPQRAEDITSSGNVKFQVVGILSPSGTSDDDVVFVDIKSSWIIDGFGHGHEDVETVQDRDKLLSRDDKSAIVNESVAKFIEITDENIGSFHFHSSLSKLPISALILDPVDEKSATFLTDKINEIDYLQIVEPSVEIEKLIEKIFRVKTLFNIASAAIFIVTGLFLVLNTLLSIRLRSREMITMYKIGCGRFTILGLFVWEYLIVILLSVLLALLLSTVTVEYVQQMILQMIR